ncbi:hypothetical protein A0H81_09254 [Grifola frondosa]|uniref:F-box domain-containing protein n=1 Tax=Grifola frondosa TaxID=5627 RepID=A0A1C7M2Y2_GRIFR|nr:hypothetical protein A0H81_09254 [Grifola frondosa]
MYGYMFGLASTILQRRKFISITPSEAELREKIRLFILSHLEPDDRKIAARVCRTWRSEVRKIPLIATARLDFTGSRREISYLEEMLQESKLLRDSIQELLLDPQHKRNVYGWLQDHPLPRLDMLQLRSMGNVQQHIPDWWRDISNLTVRRLNILFPCQDMNMVKKFLSIKTLETLCITLPSKSVDPDFQLHPMPSLTRLSLTVVDGDSPHILRMLMAIQASIARFDLTVTGTWKEPEDLRMVLITLPFPQLRHLTIQIHEAMEKPRFMDELLRRLTQLQSLTCPQGMYSIELLRLLPQGLRKVWLSACPDTPLWHDAASAAIDRVINGESDLAELVVPWRCAIDIPDFDPLKEKCNQAGVRLKCPWELRPSNLWRADAYDWS